MSHLQRRVFLDYDARPDPKTSRYCSRCQRDLRADQPARSARLDVEAMELIHPDDVRTGEGVWVLLGEDCARKTGWEFTVAEGRGS